MWQVLILEISLLKLLYVYDFFILNSRQKVLLRKVRQFKVFLRNLGEQTTKAKILCSFCFHSKLFIATFIVCNFFENNFSQHLVSATFCIKVARKISQLSQFFLPATISANKVLLTKLFYSLLKYFFQK